MRLGFSLEYRRYINSRQWKARRQRALELADFHCQLCGRSGSWMRLQVHHNNYHRLGREADSDLIALCGDCHLAYTWYSRIKRVLTWLKVTWVKVRHYFRRRFR